jgi:hypothetical protein
MRHILLFALLFLVYGSLHAQVSIGFQAGYTGSSTQVKDASGKKRNTDQLRSWHFDMLFNVPVRGVDNLYVQPILRYITKGTYLTPNSIAQGSYTESTYRLNLHYLEVPLNVLYKVPVQQSRFVLGAGPYAAYSLNGTYNVNVIQNGQYLKTSRQGVNYDERDAFVAPGSTDLSRWDAGVNVLVGFELTGLLTVNANYAYGLTNLDHSHVANLTNRYLGVSVGILLNREDY